MNETIKTILERRSIRKYKEEQIKDEELKLLLKAGAYAPNGMNKQLWHFTAVQNKAYIYTISNGTKVKMRTMDIPMYQERAKDPDYHVFFNAPTVIIVSHDGTPRTTTDSAMATENIVLAAHSLGIGSCIIGSFNLFIDTPEGQAFCETLKIPTGYKPMLSIAIGYSGMEHPQAPQRKDDVFTIIK
ncbi:MAG: nitroreductase family protein [Firmicutes bacterium]|nr:nitroreductase family protein [Bacillota bacterium]